MQANLQQYSCFFCCFSHSLLLSIRCFVFSVSSAWSRRLVSECSMPLCFGLKRMLCLKDVDGADKKAADLEEAI